MGESRDAAADLDALAQSAAVRGSLLFHLYLAEALAGDALAASPMEGVAGWAVDVGADGYEVAALGGSAGAEVLRRATFAADGRAIVETGSGATATPRQARLASAREAGGQAWPADGHRFATVVVPPPRDGREPAELEVYLVRLPDRAEDMVVGPHWRLRVADGEVREATPACAVDLVVPDAARLAGPGLVLAHAEGPVPSELHVFLSLRHGFAFDVVTAPSRLRWRVDGERITRL